MSDCKCCAQSPIRVIPTVESAKPLQLTLKWSPAQGIPKWDEHGLKVEFQKPYTNSLKLDGTTFYLEQFHFHHPSEHHLGDKGFAAEVHLVHKTKDGKKAVVLGIFLPVSGVGAMETDAQFFDALKMHDGLRGNKTSVPLNPIGWLPPNTTTAIRYEGSLTTGEFEEIVSWVILGEKPINRVQYEYIFRDTKPHARALQDLNRRFVVRYPWKP